MNELDLLVEEPSAVLDAVNSAWIDLAEWTRRLRVALSRKDFRRYLATSNRTVSDKWAESFNQALKDLGITDLRLDPSGDIVGGDADD